MLPDILEKYLVNTGIDKKPPNKKGTFFSYAKKNMIPGKGKKKEDLALNIDKILYGKK